MPVDDQHIAHTSWLSIVPQVCAQGHCALLEQARRQNPLTQENPSSHWRAPEVPPVIKQAAPSGERR